MINGNEINFTSTKAVIQTNALKYLMQPEIKEIMMAALTDLVSYNYQDIGGLCSHFWMRQDKIPITWMLVYNFDSNDFKIQLSDGLNGGNRIVPGTELTILIFDPIKAGINTTRLERLLLKKKYHRAQTIIAKMSDALLQYAQEQLIINKN